MSYLKSKDGSIEASIKEMQKNLKDNAYQQMFKKELEKAGKGIGSMSDMEKNKGTLLDMQWQLIWLKRN